MVVGTVPGDIITDLQRAGHVPDPYFNATWQEPSFISAWSNGTWTYTKTFATPGGGGSVRALLVFDSIRMGAMVKLNGVHLGNCTNEFLRYVFPVTLRGSGAGDNVLSVTFGAELRIPTGGRFSFASMIDWAPVQKTSVPTPSDTKYPKRSTFGFGIVKSVYVLPLNATASGVGGEGEGEGGEGGVGGGGGGTSSNSCGSVGAAITQLAVLTFYAGGHPTSLLSDDNHAGFEVRVRATLLCTAERTAARHVNAELHVNLPEVPGARISVPIAVAVGESNHTLVLPASMTRGVQLWHPRGHGSQPLYNLTAKVVFGDSSPARARVPTAVQATRRIGFRHAALVTINESTAATESLADGTGHFSFFFRVNGAAVFSRGANMVPLDLLPGRPTSPRQLVQSVVEANMNMLRLWGGGVPGS